MLYLTKNIKVFTIFYEIEMVVNFFVEPFPEEITTINES